MRRTSRTLAAAVVALVAAVVAGSCGVGADDTAAVVGDQTITTTQVDELTRNADFIQAVLSGSSTPSAESTLPGDAARSTLLLLIQRAALENEAERWGAEITDATVADARDEVRGQVRQAGIGRLDTVVEDELARFLAARNALDERFRNIDTDSEQDLRAIYDGAPALVRRTCLQVVQVPAQALARARRLVEAGVPLGRLARRVQGAQLLADPDQGCLPVEQFPGTLGRAVSRDVRVGRTRVVRGPVVLDDGSAYFFRVERTRYLSFRAAQPDLRRIAGSLVQQGSGQWIGLVMLHDVQINPRYGSGIGVDAQGNVVVAPPQAPTVTASQLLGQLES